jgi:hypothetical protein
LRARAIRLSDEYGKELSTQQLQKLYKGRGVTPQKPVPRQGKPQLPSIEKQTAMIVDCQARLTFYHSQGYEIISIDECIFSPKQVNGKQWAPIGRPLMHQRKYYPYPYIAVAGAASDKRGYIHSYYKVGAAHDHHDTLQFIKELHARSGDRFAIFADNASYHHACDIDWYCK